MCENATSIRTTQLKCDRIFTLNIKACHLTERINDNEIQCLRSELFPGSPGCSVHGQQ